MYLYLPYPVEVTAVSEQHMCYSLFMDDIIKGQVQQHESVNFMTRAQYRVQHRVNLGNIGMTE